MLDLNDAKEESTLSNNKYQEVGIWDNIKVSTVISGKSFSKQTPFIRIVTEGVNGEVGESGDMYLNNDLKEGSTTTAWSITARKLVNFIVAVTGKTEEQAKASCIAIDGDDLAKKLSTLLVGKTFRGVFYGKEIQGKEGKNNWVKAYFAVSKSNYAAESMKVAKSASKLRFDETKNIERLPVADTTMASSNGSTSPWN